MCKINGKDSPECIELQLTERIFQRVESCLKCSLASSASFFFFSSSIISPLCTAGVLNTFDQNWLKLSHVNFDR